MNGRFTTSSRPAFVVNTRAGCFAKPSGSSLLDRLRRVVGSRGDLFVTKNEADLTEAIREIVVLGSPRRFLVFCGGDGTYLAGMTALHRLGGEGPLPALILARGGTVSTAARNWGGRSVLRSAADVVHRPELLRVAERPTLAVDDGGGVRVATIFGTGLVARFFEEYERVGAGGNGPAFRIALRTFGSSLVGGELARRILTPMACRLVVDGRALPSAGYSLVVCSVLRDLGLHLLVTYRGGVDPSRPHLVASALPPSKLGPQWPRVVLGRPILGDGGFDGLTERFVVEMPERSPYVLDGDTFHAERVEVTAGPMMRIAT